MSGCGYSMWAVPNNYKALQQVYGIKHIPHVTLSTMHPSRPIPIDLGSQRRLIFTNKHLYRMPQYYYPHKDKDDTTDSAGFYCTLDTRYSATSHHMTMFYDFGGMGPYSNYKAPPEDIIATVYRADTRSPNPEEWYFF